MARYNTVAPVGTQSSAGTITTPNQGLFTTLTGTAPYTVTIANPVLFTGSTQTFYNSTSGIVTLSTPSGAFNGPGSTGSATLAMPANTLVQVISDGTNYITVQDDGSTFLGTTGQFSGTLNADGNFSVATNKFNVTASTGDTSIAGIPSFNTTSHMLIPKGTTAQRPGSPVQGYTRYNTDQNYLETYNGTSWTPAGENKHVDVINTSYTASSWDFCWVSTTTTAVTITLPASPVRGDTIRFVDIGRTFSARNLTIARNGKPIQGDAADLTVNTNGAAFDLIFYDNTYGWRIFSI